MMEDGVLQQLAEELNLRYHFDLDFSQVCFSISSVDDMYVTGAEKHYLSVGLSGLGCILQSMACFELDKHDIKRVLDFPCGWGRVLRFIKAYFGESEIVAADLQQDALSFVKEAFAVETVVSSPDLTKVKLPGLFDVVWCGSLFTHLDRKGFSDLFSLLWGCVNQNGILVFTTIGRSGYRDKNSKPVYGDLSNINIVELLHQYHNSGFGYVNYPKRDDYGISLVKLEWLLRFIGGRGEVGRTMHIERFYDDQQDLIACKKL